MRKIALTFVLLGVLVSCGNNDNKKNTANSSAKKAKTEQKEEITYDKVDGVAVDMENKGVGPIDSVEFTDEIDQDLADKGNEIYDVNCLACHKTDKKFIGPAPKDIFERRAPEWVMNMILNPERMVKEDPIAKQLLKEYNGSPMANQGLTEDEARAILEYFRTL